MYDLYQARGAFAETAAALDGQSIDMTAEKLKTLRIYEQKVARFEAELKQASGSEAAQLSTKIASFKRMVEQLRQDVEAEQDPAPRN